MGGIPQDSIRPGRGESRTHPTAGFHFEAGEASGRNERHVDAHTDGVEQGLMETLGEACVAVVRGRRFDLEKEIDAGSQAANLDTVFGDDAGGSQDAVDGAGVDIDTAHDEHVVDASDDSAEEGEIECSAGAAVLDGAGGRGRRCGT